jgi:hypothetical protein
VFELKRETTADEVNALFRQAAAKGPLAGILGYEERPLVSADYARDTRSSIVDALSTMVTDGTLLKVYAWYDNEMGYACRMVDLACHLQRQGSGLPPAMNPGTRNYAIVTAAYWGFTLTDGALRMLVLLHFYRLGYSPFTLAFLFLLYEAMGVVANLIGGWLATRYGIARMLAVGLATQITGFLLLSALSPGWTAAMSVAWVVLAQGICGVAKDLTKTASKSAIKLTAGEASGQLFKWVAFFTGSKNAMKGVGFFLGGLLLQTLGFQHSLWMMAACWPWCWLGVCCLRAAADGQEQGVEVGEGAVRQEPRHQPAGRRARGAVRRARRVVRGRRAGVPVCGGLDLHHGRRLLALWTIGYGAGAGAAPGHRAPQRRRPEHRGAGRAPVVGAAGGGADGAGGAGAGCRCRTWSGWWSAGWAVRLRLRGQFVGALLPGAGLCRLGEGGRGRGLLLRRQCAGPLLRHAAVGPAVPVGRPAAPCAA